MPKSRAEYDRRYEATEKARARRRRYNRSAKGRACDARYDRSEKGRARDQRYADTHIAVQSGGVDFRFKIPAEKKEELQERLATFRQKQREELRDARIG